MKKEDSILSIHLLIERDVASYSSVADKWRIKIRKSVTKSRQKLAQTIASEDDYERKVVQPSIKAFCNMLNPAFVSKEGLSAAQIIANHKKGLMNSASEYFKGIHKAYKTQSNMKGRYFKRIIDKKTANYLNGCRDSMALSYAKYPKKSVIALALMGLASTTKIQKRFLKETDIMDGTSLNITKPEETGLFRQALSNQILKSGCVILRMLKTHEKTLMNPTATPEVVSQFIGPEEALAKERAKQAHQELIQAINQGNEELNKLANRYRRADITPFAPDGKSHINFVFQDQTDNNAPAVGRHNIDLYLNISVKEL